MADASVPIYECLPSFVHPLGQFGLSRDIYKGWVRLFENGHLLKAQRDTNSADTILQSFDIVTEDLRRDVVLSCLPFIIMCNSDEVDVKPALLFPSCKPQLTDALPASFLIIFLLFMFDMNCIYLSIRQGLH